MCRSVPVMPLAATASAGTPSPKSVLKTGDALLQEGAEPGGVPLGGFRVGEVDDADEQVGAVPGVGEVDLAGGAAEEVAVFGGFFEVGAEVGDVGVDPQADAEAEVGEVGEHLFGVGEGVAVPVQVGPVSFGLPVAVEVEDVAGDAAFADGAGAFHDPLLGVVDESGGDPGAERPFGGRAGRQVSWL